MESVNLEHLQLLRCNKDENPVLPLHLQGKDENISLVTSSDNSVNSK
jgi:hypothetical protein